MTKSTTGHTNSEMGASVGDYFSLMKPRVMSLVVFTAFCGLWLAPGDIHPLIAFVAILCITLGAGASAAINMWYDRDIDAIMTRTQKRPIITGAILPDEALSFGIMSGFMSVFLMALCVNLVASALLALTILYYIFIYTIWLKRTSIQNVVIGGASGALPPMIGWAAVTGDVSLESFTLFAIIFIWTPPHSWALALFRLQDYRNCAVPMMPVIKGESYTKKQILLYSILMIFVVMMPYFLGMANILYLGISLILGAGFLYYVAALFQTNENQETETHGAGTQGAETQGAKALFWYSIFYLFTIFLSLLFLKLPT
ncbi:MAG: protoheme IX farnesyltransferase [Rickettsiales bacterium]|nr:MAG: protoheme IX farnesyltransferase [Rickettsiales bacterium]